MSWLLLQHLIYTSIPVLYIQVVSPPNGKHIEKRLAEVIVRKRCPRFVDKQLFVGFHAGRYLIVEARL
ncbi:hypothetical protein OKW21_003068 [Catalinimonas alkaloidigena]|uniref:hypothetical protein n=1 Tax=Catalinimonas alkaloidigena TaxID=1075417 RepID=UPI002404FAC8|nr:hypothetical protein [Catalinimonas alkaloidigena]MDF9797805.1 hypothetical protein [Catalinimonas alkaloidigena]